MLDHLQHYTLQTCLHSIFQKCITWKFLEKKDWGIKQFWGKLKIRKSGGSSCIIMYWGCMLMKTCMGAHRQDMKFKEVLWRFSKIYWSEKQQTKQKKIKKIQKQKEHGPRLWASITRQKKKEETKTQRVVILVNACGRIVSKREAWVSKSLGVL